MSGKSKRAPASTSSLSLQYSTLTTSLDRKPKDPKPKSLTQNDAPPKKRKGQNEPEGRAKKQKPSTDADDETPTGEILRERRNARKTVDIMNADSERIQNNPAVRKKTDIPDDIPVNDKAPPQTKRTYEKRPPVPDRPLNPDGVAPRQDLAPPSNRDDAVEGLLKFKSESVFHTNNRPQSQYRYVHPKNVAIYGPGRVSVATNQRDAGVGQSSVGQRASGDYARRDTPRGDQPMPDVNNYGASQYPQHSRSRRSDDSRELVNNQGHTSFATNERDAGVGQRASGDYAPRDTPRGDQPMPDVNNYGASQYPQHSRSRRSDDSREPVNNQGHTSFATNERHAGVGQRASGDYAPRDTPRGDQPMPDVNNYGASQYPQHSRSQRFDDSPGPVNNQGHASFATDDRDAGIRKSSVDRRASGDDALKVGQDELMPKEDGGREDLVGDGAAYDDGGDATSDEYEQEDDDSDDDDEQDLIPDNSDDDGPRPRGRKPAARAKSGHRGQSSAVQVSRDDFEDQDLAYSQQQPPYEHDASRDDFEDQDLAYAARQQQPPYEHDEQEPEYRQRYREVDEAVNGPMYTSPHRTATTAWEKHGQDLGEELGRGPQNERRGQDLQDDSGRGDRGGSGRGRQGGDGKQPTGGRDVVDDFRKKNKAVRPPDPAKLAECRRSQQDRDDDVGGDDSDVGGDDDGGDDDDVGGDDDDVEETDGEQQVHSKKSRRKRTASTAPPKPTNKAFYANIGDGWCRFIELFQVRMQLYMIKVNFLPTKEQVFAIAPELLTEAMAKYNDMYPDFPLDPGMSPLFHLVDVLIISVQSSFARTNPISYKWRGWNLGITVGLTRAEEEQLQQGGSNQEEALDIVTKRIVELTTKSKYLRRLPTAKDPSSCNFGHPALGEMIHILLWKPDTGRRDCLGALYPEEFKTFDQHRLICAGASVLCHCLDEYSSGVFDSGTYSAPSYVKHYHSVLMSLRTLETNPAHHQKTRDEWAFWHWKSFGKPKKDVNAGRADLCDVVFD
ncbi:hypothetical protein C8R47DRAFT_1225718 [Mycena vitilis]|nr:hypothetical protein C8R47DRAFT_1225718 [Mycena vitilis]